MNILITGTTGFIGGLLADRLSAMHTVIGLARGRSAQDKAHVQIQGSFEHLEDLQQLDAYKLDAVVHLAAVTGGCTCREHAFCSATS